MTIICAHNFSRPFFALRVFLRGTFYAVLREEMEISKAESFDFVTAYFRGRRSVWFPLLLHVAVASQSLTPL